MYNYTNRGVTAVYRGDMVSDKIKEVNSRYILIGGGIGVKI